MKYAVKFSLDTDGFTNWDEDQIEDPDITFSIVIYPSLEDAQKAVNQDFIDFRDDTGFYSNDTVKSTNGRWLVANDMKMYGGTAVTGIGEAYAVSYEVSGDCDYASMIIESVSPASEEDETHMESDLEEGYVEGVYICEASWCDTEDVTKENFEIDLDPLLDSLSLEKRVENEIYPDFDDDELDYYNGTLCNLYDKYGIEAVDKHIDSWTTDDIGSLMEHLSQNEDDRNLCLKLAEQNYNILYWICDYYFSNDNRPYYNEELYRLTDLQIKSGDELQNTIVGQFALDWIEDMEGLLALWQPTMFKKYGLEVLEEEMIRLFNTEDCYELWDDFDNQTIDYPNFLHDLVPVLNAYIAKGSVDAANVLIKAFQAGKEGYFADVTHFTVPECVTDIPTDTFGGCKNLIAVALPDGLKRIGPFAFYECTGLSSITIPESVNKIGESVFEECESLTDVVLPDGLTEIEDRVFAACTSLSSIKIPAGVNKIGKDAFESCESLTDVVLPDGLTEIEDGVFAYCTGLSSITIPKGVIKIGQRAFMDLLNLSRVILPIGVKTIHADAFEGCDSLQEILVPAHKTDYYKKRLPSELWDKIVELDNSNK